MRLRRAIELEAMPIETPCKLRITREDSGIGDVFERKPVVSQRGVCAPETIVAAETRESRIDAHPCPCGDEQAVGFAYPCRCLREFSFIVHSSSRLCMVEGPLRLPALRDGKKRGAP